MKNVLKGYGCNVFDTKLDVLIQRQFGVLRTNCLDCLDRTNVVQTLFAKLHLQNWMQQLGLHISPYDRENMEISFNNLWADNGDWLSKIYAGTGALKSSYTRNGKQTLFGFIDDATKSAARFYMQNFQDKGRQEAIDLLLSTNFQIPASKVKNTNNAIRSKSNILIYCGTYNFNGQIPSSGESLHSWLASEAIGLADMAVIGCQELIKLTPGEVI